MSHLHELADRVEALTEPSREVDAEIYVAILGPEWKIQTDCPNFPDEVRAGRIQEIGGCGWRNSPRYTSSLDAAETLLPESARQKSDLEWNVEAWTTNGVHAPHVRATAWVAGARRVYAATPARALTAACLRARATPS